MKRTLALLLTALWTVVAAAAGVPAVGSPAPEFSLPDQAGRTVRLADFRGEALVARRLTRLTLEAVDLAVELLHHVFDALKFRAPYFDQAVSALIEDVYARGLDKRVLVVVTGEFGRTPRISYVASSGGGVASAPAGTVQPGRDHWPRANSMIWAGGGIRTGQLIGSTDRRGEDVVSRRVGPQDFLATAKAFERFINAALD